MKLKKLLIFLIYGVQIGFILGLVRAIKIISSQNYFSYKLHRLIFFSLIDSINRGIIYSLITIVLLILLIKIIIFIWTKLFSPFFEFKITRKKNLTPLIKGFYFGILLTYWIFHLLKLFLSPQHNIRPFLTQSLIISCLLLLGLLHEKINFRLLKSKILYFTKSAGIKKMGVGVLSFYILINLFSIGQKVLNPPSGPNVLLIVADALRADHLGCYGYDRPTSPQIDKFANESVVFEKAMSNAPWTKPSLGTVFTSLYPHEHQALYWMDNLNTAYITLAEVFSEMNYTTFAVQANPVLTKKYNFQQGFKHYNELILKTGEEVTAKFNTWLEKNKSRPFFAYLHFMDSHLPYNAPDEFKAMFEPEALDSQITSLHGAYQIRILNEIGLSSEDKQHLINLYDAEVRYFDWHFGKIVDNLKKLKILNKTIVILTADHGEEFWEHNGIEHGHTLYNEVLQVPLIIKFSSKFPTKRIKSFVHLIDLFPTILNMTRIDKDLFLRGRNLTPVILNDSPINDESYFEGILAGAEKKAVIKDGWKLIENTGLKNKEAFNFLGGLEIFKYSEQERGFELYDINNDFSEKFNLINEYPQVATNLKKRLLAFRTNYYVLPRQDQTKLKEKLDDLRSLGYIK